MKTIIEMAGDAGFKIIDNMIFVEGWEINPYMQRFAALVRADEREACAKAALDAPLSCLRQDTRESCADAIRARGDT